MARKKRQNAQSADYLGTKNFCPEGMYSAASDYFLEESYWEKVRRTGNRCVWDDDCYSCPYFSECALWWSL